MSAVQIFSFGASCALMLAPAELPPGSMPYAEFSQKFRLGSTTTEKLHPVTHQLSQTFHRDPLAGLKLLCKVEEDVIQGVETHLKPTIEQVSPYCRAALASGGRLFFVGSGSSGRIAIDLSAKVKARYPELGGRVYDIMAGDDAALVRAKEGFEDSDADGANALHPFKLNGNDVVFLISGSGSASFNVGAGHAAANAGARVYYFYNSSEVPTRTKELFTRSTNRVLPLLLDTGPQAIAGSTRLQAATEAEIFLGAVLEQAFTKNPDSSGYPEKLKGGLNMILAKIRQQLPAIDAIVQAQRRAFSSPIANFYQTQDCTDQGYVTLLATPETIRAGFMDMTETAPTFSTNPTRREREGNLKREEFRAYLMGADTNKEAWETILGRPLHPDAESEAFEFLMAANAEGLNSFAKRPMGKGNVALAALQLRENEALPQAILQGLGRAKAEGAETGVVIICEGALSLEQKQLLQSYSDYPVYLESIPQDHLGILPTVALKWTLNLISNSAMVAMNKVLGNRMIDVQPANYKLVDRVIRLISEIWQESFPDQVCDYETLYHYVLQVRALRKKRAEEGHYTPSVVKIVLTMLHMKKTPAAFDEVVARLSEKQERLDFLG